MPWNLHPTHSSLATVYEYSESYGDITVLRSHRSPVITELPPRRTQTPLFCQRFARMHLILYLHHSFRAQRAILKGLYWSKGAFNTLYAVRGASRN